MGIARCCPGKGGIDYFLGCGVNTAHITEELWRKLDDGAMVRRWRGKDVIFEI